jgi:putative ABC transport system permease protein
VPPRAVLSRASLEKHARQRLPALAAAALAVALAGLLAVRLLPGSLLAGFAGLFAVIAAGALLAPPAITGLVWLILAALGARLALPVRMAIRGVSASLSRTGVAVAALMVAVATVIGVGVMVGSFRMSVDQWLQNSLRADVYLSLDESFHAAGTDVETLVERLLAAGPVGDISRQVRSRLRTDDGEIRVWGLDPGAGDWGLELLAKASGAPRQGFESGEAVLISEPFARRRDLAAGDRVELPAPDGPRTFVVAAVFRDYTSDQGVVAVYLPVFRQIWQVDRLDGLGLFAAPGFDAGAVKSAAERVIGGAPGVALAANAEIRAISLSIFDRTFTITRVLQFLVGVVAFLGILSALQSLQMERVRELAVLRALGWTPSQVRQLVIGQTTMLGASAGLFAVPLGLVLALMLIEVINTRAFGWSMGMHIESGVIAQGLAMAVTAAVLGGLYPAWRAGQRRPAADLRDE